METRIDYQWRGQAVSTAAIDCEPGQIRKEAAAAIKSGVVVGLAVTATIFKGASSCPLDYL